MASVIPDILYEDNHLIVAVKPMGVLSQSDGSSAPDMLNILKTYIREKYSKPGNIYLALLHRLDRNVEGVMVFAKTDKAASRISDQIREHKMQKRYRAVVNGTLDPEEGVMENYLLKVKAGNGYVSQVYDSPMNQAKLAKLEYKVLGKARYKEQDISLIDIDLGTGRYHQIRSQMAHRGHPLLGDRKYGDKLLTIEERICLQSYKIALEHPVKHEYMEFVLPIKDEIPWNIFGGDGNG